MPWGSLVAPLAGLNSRKRLPLILLLIGMSTVFIFGNDRGYFFRNTWNPSHHFPWVSSQHLAIATNFSPIHHFLLFMSQGFDVEGNIDYDVYNRFPPGGYALIKLATLPFGDDLSNRIYAGQILMLVLYMGTAVLAYLSLYRLTSSRWVALSSVLIVFSSTQLLRWNDMIITEHNPSLFGFILVFNGIVIFSQEDRLRQLVVKACIALLLGWHVLALLLAFVLLGLVKQVIRIRKANRIREIAFAIVTSRYFILGLVALGFSIMVVTYNIGNEYYALNVRGTHNLALLDTPSLSSALKRTGLSQGIFDYLPGVEFIENQLRRIGQLLVPFALNWLIGALIHDLYIGTLVVITCIIGVFLVPESHRLLAATAVLAGFLWVIPAHRVVENHGIEYSYHVGISLFFVTLALLVISRLTSEHFMPLVSVVALVAFVFSSHRINYPGQNGEIVEFHEAMVEDFDEIRMFTKGKNVLVPVTGAEVELMLLMHARYGLQYYLSGSRIIFNNYDCDPRLDKADFVIQFRRYEASGLLTPANTNMFLYDRHIYAEYIDKMLEEKDPIIRGDFDVYLTDNRKLIYVRDRCNDPEYLNLGAPISILTYPVDTAYLPEPGLDHEFNTLYYIDHFIMDTNRYIVIFDLPDYDIARISTGQYTDRGQIWGGKFYGPNHKPDIDLLRRVDQAIASHEPIIRDQFDIYLTDDKTLIYVREPCNSEDYSDDFFIHVIPSDAQDLPEHRKQLQFDNFDFDFFDRGTTDGRRCAAAIELPDYDIAHINTGQYTNQGPTWQGEFNTTDG